MTFTMEPMDGKQITILSDVYTALLIPSVIGSFSVLVVSIVKRQRLGEQVHLLVQLALADLLAALTLFVISILNTVSYNFANTCQYVLPLALTFYLTSFLLVVLYAWKSKDAIQGWRERLADDENEQSQCKKIKKAFPIYAFLWLVPIALYTLYVVPVYIKEKSLIPMTDRSQSNITLNGSSSSCILFLHVWKEPYTKSEQRHIISIRLFLLIAVIVVMVSCSVIYYKVQKWYKRREQEGLFPVYVDGYATRRSKKVFSSARNMVMVIVICWTPVLVLIILSFWGEHKDQKKLFVLYIIQAVTLSLQGFLNSMVYAWGRPNFTEAVLGEKVPLTPRMPFFDESLRSHC
ncbi:Transmembrane protein 116 [Oryzias melastigma]|uniref:Si:dkey-30c15.2 n=1 Tax=Oryzias melastigma TaxID=30732 RepID=A0A3B3BPG8_ORYME|nr:transmembrane protein 116 [Oryzias melastigma]KAF6735041.1 Transmembrane protein 116 [Oryzias melastigma]